jgi:hypothetical protein
MARVGRLPESETIDGGTLRRVVKGEPPIPKLLAERSGTSNSAVIVNVFASVWGRCVATKEIVLTVRVCRLCTDAA